LPHDRLRDFVVYEDKLYTLWLNGWVTAHEGLDASLDRDETHYDLAADRGEAFILMEEHAGASGVPRGLYLQRRDGGYLRRAGTSWADVTPDVERLLNAYRASPPVYARDGLRLLSTGQGRLAFTFQYRSPEGTWTDLAWSGGIPRWLGDRRLKIDQWFDFHPNGNRIWAATPQGLVAFSYARGRIELDTRDLRVVREPLDRDDEPFWITDIRIDAEDVWLRADGRSETVFRGVFDDGAGKASFQRVDNDPFADEDWIEGTNQVPWQWLLRGRSGNEQGRLSAVLNGEPVRFVEGRFAWDGISSLAMVRTGEIETAAIGGWYRWRDDQLSLAMMERPDMEELDARDVVEVRRGLVDGEPMLGLRTITGDYLRLGASGSGRVEAFPHFQGADGFWDYFSDAGQPRITSSRTTSGTVERILQNGRFGDHYATGLPITVEEGEGVVHLLPSRAGILRYDENFQPQMLLSGAFPGLQAGATPSVLFSPAPGQVMYAADQGFHVLDGERGSVAGLPLDLPSGSLESVSLGREGSIRLDWIEGDARGRRLIDASSGDDGSGRDGWLIDLSSTSEFRRNRLAWNDPDPWLHAYESEDGLALHWPAKEHRTTVTLPPGFTMTGLFHAGDKLLLLGREHLFQVDLGRALLDEIVR
jgi:hypothetical protein